MSGPSSRRGFLSGLATLPLIGGSVAILGNPTAAALPVTGGTIATYLAWLDAEQRYLAWAVNARGFTPALNPGFAFHGRGQLTPHMAAREAIQRAPVVLAAAGCRLTSPDAEAQCGDLFSRCNWLEGVR